MKVLEINNIDLPGRRFNGYNMIKDLSDKELIIKQAVIYKESNDRNVVQILKDDFEMDCYNKMVNFENQNSIHNILSITSPALMNLNEYKQADIVHFHMFHNTKLSLFSLLEISKEKKIVITLHDPWFLTGRCVHFYECNKWETGCNNCEFLDTLFPFSEDNSSMMWQIKKSIFENINVDIIVTSKWMYDLVKKSPIFSTQKRVHLVPLGIDVSDFNVNITQKSAKDHFNIPSKNMVLFLRAQNEFKGTEYVLKSLKILKEKNISILTCDNKNLLNDVKDKYQIIDLGTIEDREIIRAMNACDIFLMPSKSESFGMMAVEAMACGKPVIIFNNSALPSVTFAPECGYSVENRNYKDLAHAIKYLLNNPKEMKKRGELGKKYCNQVYNINDYNSKIKNIYLSIFNISIKKNINFEDKYIRNFKKNLLEFNKNYINNNNICKRMNTFVKKYKYKKNCSLINDYNNQLYQELIAYNRSINNAIIRKIKQIVKNNKFLYRTLKSIVKKFQKVKKGKIENEKR